MLLGPAGITTPQVAVTPPYLDTWAGTGFANHFWGVYTGAVWAQNETKNLWIDGTLLRFDFAGGAYSYNSTAFPNTRVPTYAFDFLFGYRKKIGEGLLTGYIGPVYEEQDNPDPAASIRGGTGGVRGILEYSATIASNYQVYSQASYSTPFKTYYALGRVGFRPMASVWIGPEAQIFGIAGPYRESRVGGYLTFETALGEITFNGGYAHPLTVGPDGYYAGIYLGHSFR